MARLHAHRAHKIAFIEDDVLASELPADSADFVISSFGLKTFNPGQHKRLAALVARALKPGGSFSLIEASDPKGWWLRPLYLFHLKVVLPLVERLLLRGAQDFAMIGAYSTAFGDASAFAAMLATKGWRSNIAASSSAAPPASRDASPAGADSNPISLNRSPAKAFGSWAPAFAGEQLYKPDRIRL